MHHPIIQKLFKTYSYSSHLVMSANISTKSIVVAAAVAVAAAVVFPAVDANVTGTSFLELAVTGFFPLEVR